MSLGAKLQKRTVVNSTVTKGFMRPVTRLARSSGPISLTVRIVPNTEQ